MSQILPEHPPPHEPADRTWRPAAGYFWMTGRLYGPEGLVLAAPDLLGAIFSEPRVYIESELVELLMPDVFVGLTQMGALIPADSITLRELFAAPERDFPSEGTVLVGVSHVSSAGADNCAFGPGLIRAAAPSLKLQSGATERPMVGRILDHPCAALWDAGTLTAPGWLESYAFAADWRLIALGGDHSITWRALSGLARRRGPIALLHIDAHDDCAPPVDPAHDRLNHASFLRFALTHPPLCDALAGVVTVGLRATLDRSTGYADSRLRSAEPEDAAAKLAAIGAPCIAVTIDMDVLDPAFAPGVSHPEPGGLNYMALIRMLAEVEATTPPDYLDIVETAESHLGPTSALAGALLTDLIHLRYGRISGE